MSTGRTQSFFSICSRRLSAEQREDHQVDPGAAGKRDEIVDAAELGHAAAARRAALVAAVVEHADDVNVGIALGGERADERFAIGVGADHDGAAIEAAFARPAPHQQEQHAPERDQREPAEHVEAAEPGPRELVA
jgi:hypothetical protein